MTILGIRSVLLSTKTANAWKSGGVRLAQRGRTTDQLVAQMLAGRFSVILNLGKSSFAPRVYRDRVWNFGEDIRPLLHPGATRAVLDDLMPPRPEAYPADVWIKAPGSQGRGKFKKQIEHPLVLPSEWDWQNHIEGQEYRLVTVGHRVVQDYLRNGSNRQRTYRWVPMREVPTQVKAVAREAARRIPGKNVIAWDLIVTPENEVFLFEGNTCPGVNTHTVERIVAEITRQEEQNDLAH